MITIVVIKKKKKVSIGDVEIRDGRGIKHYRGRVK